MGVVATLGAYIGGFAGGALGRFITGLFSDFIDSADDLVRTEIAIQLGAVRNWSAEAFDGLVEATPNPTVGMSPEGMMDVLERFLRATAQIGLCIGSEVAEELFMELIQEGFSNAIQTSLGGSFQTILNVWRGGSPPSPDELEAVVGKVADMDEDTLALLIAMTGSNLPTTYYRVSRGFDTYVDDQTRLIREQLIDILNRANHAVTWLYEACRSIATDELNDAIGVIKEAYGKGISLLDEIAERALSRLQELKTELMTAKEWLKYAKEHPQMPIITDEEASYVGLENYEEAVATYQTYLSIKKTIESTLANIDITIDDIIEKIDDIIMKYIDHLNNMTEVGALDFSEELTKLNNALLKVVAYRNAVENVTEISTPTESTSFATGFYAPTVYELTVTVTD